MTEIEKQEIIDEVLESIRTNSRTIESLTPQQTISDDALIELNGGRMISFGLLKTILSDAFSVTNNDKALKELVEKGAERLRTARKIWGQEFDGSKNVDGDMTVNGTATINGPTNATSVTAYNFTFKYADGPKPQGYIKNYNGSDLMIFDLKTGNIGIGGNPDEKLHVFGNIMAEGDVSGENIQTLEEDVGDLKTKAKVIDALEQSEVLPFVAVIEGSEDIHDFHSGKEGYYYSTEEGFFFYCNEKKQVSKADEPYNVSAGLGQVGGSAPGSKVANKARLYQSVGKLYYFEGSELVEYSSIADSADIIYTPETRQLSITEAAKRAVFNDRWDMIFAGQGGYKPNEAPDAEHPYQAYDLWLTYEEALAVDEYSPLLVGTGAGPQYTIGFYHKMRTMKPIVYREKNATVTIDISAFHSSAIETLNLTQAKLNGTTVCYMGKLKSLTLMWFAKAVASINAPLLEEVRFDFGAWVTAFGAFSFGFPNSPKLSLESLQNMASKSWGSAITITVHADVFAKLIGDDESEAFTSLSPEEKTAWAKVLTDAQAKNITFATA